MQSKIKLQTSLSRDVHSKVIKAKAIMSQLGAAATIECSTEDYGTCNNDPLNSDYFQ